MSFLNVVSPKALFSEDAVACPRRPEFVKKTHFLKSPHPKPPMFVKIGQNMGLVDLNINVNINIYVLYVMVNILLKIVLIDKIKMMIKNKQKKYLVNLILTNSQELQLVKLVNKFLQFIFFS